MTKRKTTVRKHVVHRARASKAVKPRKGARKGKALGSIRTPKETIYVTYSTSPPRRKARK